MRIAHQLQATGVPLVQGLDLPNALGGAPKETSGACPTTLPLAPRMPATCVPCPAQAPDITASNSRRETLTQIDHAQAPAARVVHEQRASRS